VRAIQTFILRLLVDPAEPNALRGSLHSVADDADYVFADAQALLNLLRQISNSASTDTDLSLKNQREGNDEQAN